MQIKKFVATGLAALMAGATLAGAALAATQLGTALNTIGQQAVSGTPYLVVVGAKAAPSDVVGAIDVASALAQQMYTTKTIAGTTTTSVEGKEVTTLHFGVDTLSNAFGTTLTKTQIPFLFRDKLTYNNTDYYVEEQIHVPSATVDNTPSTLNGTVFIDFSSAVPEYKYVFDGNVSTPTFGSDDAYAHPVLVKIMGEPYYVINTGSNSITVMSGTVGMADASTAVSYGGYSVYVIDGGDTWAKIQIKDSTGTVVKTDIINKGGTYTYSDLGLKVKLLEVWPSTVSNTVTGKLVVGSELEKTINSGDEFAPYWQWHISIQVPNTQFTAGDYIGVKYAPNDTATKYLPIGSTLKAPNDYFEIGYTKNMVDQFAHITVQPGTVSAYSSPTNTTAQLSSQPAIIITADYPVFNTGSSSKAAIIVDSDAAGATYTPAYLAYYDESANKYVISGTVFNITNGHDTITIQGSYDQTSFKIYYDLANKMNIEVATDANITANYTYSTSNKKFTLGNANEAEGSDISALSNAVTGTWDHDAVSPYGVVLKAVKTNADNDKVVLEIPADQQAADVYIGKATTTSTGGTSYKAIVPLTTTVAKLDSEVTAAEKTNDNLILVGGPCINDLVAELANAGTFPYTCQSWPGSNFGVIKAIDNAFATGKVALVVAGTRAQDTRLATSALALGNLGDAASSDTAYVTESGVTTVAPA